MPPAPHQAAGPESVPAPAVVERGPENALVLRGGHWEIAYGGCTGIAEDCRGLRYISVLLRDAANNGPVHARELVARATGQASVAIELQATTDILDRAAEAELRKRVEEIGFERTRAAAAEDFARVAALEDECDRIADELSRARRRAGGRRATFDDGDEKARKAVSKAIAEAMARIEANPDLAPLAHHLTTSLRKGLWLSYTGNLAWHIEFPVPLPRK